ncbi:putative damage-inducible protein DinB [Deinococcus metalli]|uniref:Putative damage-inducible protein DinB n=1 Tax=Deinococcus metalli TaxID=1141878 RepID=A0A7W8KAE1_9DEIO|nr:DUF664 domain-containing protein [Deinococcus metalli]MBB5374635.1 putative damage-inducible protein DinB [Deinococcus metalli]GHF34846.1 hypothetical protein GCM10017781_09620 [Deinococcus metalli]
MSDFLISDRPGFTPMIARLVGMMEYGRETTLQAVQGMSVEELDLIPPEFGNSAGMLLEHFAAVERIYQLISEGHPNPDEALEAKWWPGLDLGERGRADIRGRPLRHYLTQLAEVRAQTLRLFAAHDDVWLDEPLPFWGSTGNRHFMWFHVFEDELNHRGQLRLIHKFLPRLRDRGMLGAGFGAASDGRGLRCIFVQPGSPAALAGLREGDVVLTYDGQDVTGVLFDEVALTQAAGVTSAFRVRRDDGEHALNVTRVTRPG